MVSQEYSSSLMKIGFPKTDKAFSKFNDTMKQHIATRPEKIIGIFDDFHLVQENILTDRERKETLYQLKKRNKAIAAFTEAYHLAESNKIIVSFTEHAKDMRTLTLAAQKNDTAHEEKHRIPNKWL